MTFLVLCVLDLKEAKHEDYMYAYMDLSELGLHRAVKGDGASSFKLPGDTVMGAFEGRSVEDVRTRVARSIQSIFKMRSLRGDFFVVASADWACAGEST